MSRQWVETFSGMVAPDVPLTSAPPEMARAWAISQYWAAVVDGQDATVERFRRDYVGNALLAPDMVARWIEDTGHAEGHASPYLENVPWEALKEQDDGSYRLPANWVEALLRRKPMIAKLVDGQVRLDVDTWGDGTERPRLDTRMLWYVAPEWEERTLSKPVRPGGVLDELRRLSQVLLDTYAMWFFAPQRDPRDRRYWGLARTATYVLTGYAPFIDESLFPLRSGKGVHPQTTKHLQLAVFTARREAQTLATRMAEWNSRWPEWAYTRTTTFGWDSRQAIRRLLARDEPEKAKKGARDQASGVGTGVAAEYTAQEKAIAHAEQARQHGGRRSAVWAADTGRLLDGAQAREDDEKSKKGVG